MFSRPAVRRPQTPLLGARASPARRAQVGNLCATQTMVITLVARWRHRLGLILYVGSQEDHTSKRQKIRDSRHTMESFLPLTEGDRKKAVEVMSDICSIDIVDGDSLEQVRELQRMLMLNVKAEIQAVDDFGNISRWLDERLCQV